METSPSQSGGQGGGAWWSVQTGHPIAVTNGFHQGAHGHAGEMYMETAARGADIYLPAAGQAGHTGRGAETEFKRRTPQMSRHSWIKKLLLNIPLRPLQTSTLWLRVNAMWDGV